MMTSVNFMMTALLSALINLTAEAAEQDEDEGLQTRVGWHRAGA
jgi:hypothetical protein